MLIVLSTTQTHWTQVTGLLGVMRKSTISALIMYSYVTELFQGALPFALHLTLLPWRKVNMVSNTQ